MSKLSIDEIHNEIKIKIENHKKKYRERPKYLLLNYDLWFQIQTESKDVIPPEYKMEPDGFWYIFGLKIAMLDGSNLQARHLEVA